MSTAAEAEAEARPGLFQDPLANWANDDILLTRPARAMLGAQHLAGLRVLDWPELRALFARYEAPANRHGRRDRRLGLMSVACAVAGLSLAALAPLAAGAGRAVGVAAAAFAVAGAALFAFHWLDTGSKSRWLSNRYWTERVRALYFQVIINNLGLVARAMTNDAALGEWKVVRARALAALPHPEGLTGRIRRLAGRVGDEEVWVSPEWRTPPAPPEPSAELDVLLPLLRSQRFDTQLAYVDKKLGESFRAPGRLARAVRLGSDVLPALAVAAAAVAGVLFALGFGASHAAVQAALAVAASGTATALALRVVNEALALTDDAGRYAWYSAAVMQARNRFDAGDVAEKVAALREMEAVAYRDLREFIAAHWRARYVP